MPINSRLPRSLLLVTLIIGTLSSLIAARYRLHVETSNRRVEIGVEWDEVSRLAQSAHRAVADVLEEMKRADVAALVIQEDTLTTLEQAGLVHPQGAGLPGEKQVTQVDGLSPALFERLRYQLQIRGMLQPQGAAGDDRTRFTCGSEPPFSSSVDYSNLRSVGLGLPPDACAAATAAHLQIAGRIGNFPGVNSTSARAVLVDLAAQGASIVIFNGEEVLGYRDMEPQVAEMLKDGGIPVKEVSQTYDGAVRCLAYGAVEFGKQKGDEKLSSRLNGDLIRVHSIQVGEMGQLDREEAIDRFAKAARERNIRFCYVRLLTFSGDDPVAENVKYLNAIAVAIHKGRSITGGDMQFGAARRFSETGTPRWLYPLIGIGAGAGLVWMLALLMPLSIRQQRNLTLASCLLFALLASAGGEMGRKLTALAAGIFFPAAACLYTYPLKAAESPISSKQYVRRAVEAIALASAITSIGIVHVVGLLASRPYMVHSSQFIGIKAQHAIPLFVVMFAALIGGAAVPGETWRAFCKRSNESLKRSLSEPARWGTLLFATVALAALILVIARTGNDAGVGVSGTELKVRAILDKLMPVRPRTKEFLVGHPAFILGICWWLRGRRKLAVPAFVIGSLGQVSLLNTFCHIHTPLIVSAWRDVIGLILGTAIGLCVFFICERFARDPSP